MFSQEGPKQEEGSKAKGERSPRSHNQLARFHPIKPRGKWRGARLLLPSSGRRRAGGGQLRTLTDQRLSPQGASGPQQTSACLSQPGFYATAKGAWQLGDMPPGRWPRPRPSGQRPCTARSLRLHVLGSPRLHNVSANLGSIAGETSPSPARGPALSEERRSERLKPNQTLARKTFSYYLIL